MPSKSQLPWVPMHQSVPSFLFESPTASLPSTKPIIIDPKRPQTHYFTLHTLREWSKRFATGLVAAGFKAGDRVMLFSGNDLFTPVVVLGTLMAEGIYNSANPAYTPRELAHQLKDSEPKFILAADNCVDRALEAADLAGLSRSRVHLFETIQPDHENTAPQTSVVGNHWRSLISTPAAGESFKWKELNTPELSNRTAILVYSSGTTGLPKGVELTHYNLISNARQLRQVQFTTDPSRRRALCCVPLYHGLGLVYYMIVAPSMGMQVYLMERYNLADMLNYIPKFKLTELLLVPPILIAMSKHIQTHQGKYNVDSIQKVIAGAAPIGMEITQDFEKVFSGRLNVRQGWGMSEALCITLCWHEQDPSKESSISVGKLLPGGEAMILNDKGVELPVGERGELWMRGPNVMKGYWKNPKATSDTLTKDGWLRTGDIAYVDEDDKFYIVDRIKELIKVRGAQVAPAELEALLLEHPLLLDAAVIGAKGIGEEEYPRAYVVRREGATITEKDIVEFVSSKVSKVKRLTGGVRFVDSVPKNPSGKILRRELRERAAKELSQGTKLMGKL
ncbi:hypothetical protein BP6252_11855 [Coleophoma cylindrospora]|uniref:Uncharacterized protein n=1 Tax=Coleophoma cylindrospora TaxID=1849047 RepID=A0A3D8QKU7_9HELO|nr:hypothetical protein BP6252_11855 [Coleophoma cylindrospora]